MITYDAALAIINEVANSVKRDSLAIVSLDKNLGALSSRDIIANHPVPSFANSAMDGFALNSSQFNSESITYPIIIPIISRIAAGDLPGKLNPKINQMAIEIMTGAPIPEGCDTVVKIEDVEITKRSHNGLISEIKLLKPVFSKQNIREAGEDFKPGQIVIKGNTTIEPHHIMALAALGVSHIEIKQLPTVSVLSTGKELIDDLNQSLKMGQIRNSNGPYLIATLEKIGIKASYAGTIEDNVSDFNTAIDTFLSSGIDIMVSTGAVSKGQYDFIPDSLKQLGANILFHKVAIRPGKPILFAQFPNGKFYFGLPGNPMAAAVGLRFFVIPLIRSLNHLQPELFTQAKLSNSITKRTQLKYFQKGYSYINNEGQQQVEILSGQQSFKIHPLLQANCWVILPEGRENINTDDIVTIVRLYPNS